MKYRCKPGAFHAKKILTFCVFIFLFMALNIILNVDRYFRPLLAKYGHLISRKADDPILVDYSYDDSHLSNKQKEYCNTHRERVFKPDMFKSILVNDKYKVLYCSVPKVACTNWARMFLIMSGKLNTTNPMDIRAPDVHGKYNKHLVSLNELPEDEIKYRLKNYYKFIITREPFERILSAYLNKFRGKNLYFHSRYGKWIERRYRNQAKKQNLSGDDVTFQEFVQYLTDFTRKEPLNGHWEKITELCHPCVVKYDFIGSMENMNSDSDYILEKIGASKIGKFPIRNATYRHRSTKTYMQLYYEQITRAQLDQLLFLYYPDFLMFNLTIPETIRGITKWRGNV